MCRLGGVALVLGATACESHRRDDEATARLQETISRVDEHLDALDERLAQIEAKAEAVSTTPPSVEVPPSPTPVPTIDPAEPRPAKKIAITCEGERYRVEDERYDLAGLTKLLQTAVDESDPSVTIQCERGDTDAVFAALDAAKAAGVQRLAMVTVD